MFLQRLGKTLFVCIICGFVAGVLMALFLPPIFIAVLECVLLLFLCFCLINSSFF